MSIMSCPVKFIQAHFKRAIKVFHHAQKSIYVDIFKYDCGAKLDILRFTWPSGKYDAGVTFITF